MSSDSEISSVEQSDSEETDPEEQLENDDVDVEVVLSLVQPYEDEPLADAASEPNLVPRVFSSTIFKMAARREKTLAKAELTVLLIGPFMRTS